MQPLVYKSTIQNKLKPKILSQSRRKSVGRVLHDMSHRIHFHELGSLYILRSGWRQAQPWESKVRTCPFSGPDRACSAVGVRFCP